MMLLTVRCGFWDISWPLPMLVQIKDRSGSVEEGLPAFIYIIHTRDC